MPTAEVRDLEFNLLGTVQVDSLNKNIAPVDLPLKAGGSLERIDTPGGIYYQARCSLEALHACPQFTAQGG
jgi:hypothetical protein